MINQQVYMMKVVLLLSASASILILSVTAYQENYCGEWRETQLSYRSELIKTADSLSKRSSGSSFSINIRQNYLTDLRRIDRCVTCHLGIENPAMADAEQPLKLHSGDLIVHHPPDRFGCTICHQGQGRAMEREAAHGWRSDGEPTPHNSTPMHRGEAVYTSCGQCHYEVDLYGGQSDLFAYSYGSTTDEIKRPRIDASTLDVTLPGADVITEGKRLVIENGCLGCHRYRGGGGDLGTDLTYIGDKTKNDFDFSHIEGEHTVQQWHYEHFLQPQEVSPESLMPEMGFTQNESRTLALYMMSLHRKSAPATHTPRPRMPDSSISTEVSGETLYKMFCAVCHGKSGRGDGPAAKTIKGDPRDFWHERFRYVSTRNGVPTQKDLTLTIRTGRQFGEMPSNPQLTESEILRLTEYILELNRGGWVERLTEDFADDDDTSPEEIQEIAESRITPQRIIIVPWPGKDFVPNNEMGRQLFVENCTSCHGNDGRGDGPQELFDEKGRKITARDLTAGKFRGGDELDELFKRIRAGLPGTPMPAQDNLSDEQIWELVHFVRYLTNTTP